MTMRHLFHKCIQIGIIAFFFLKIAEIIYRYPCNHAGGITEDLRVLLILFVCHGFDCVFHKKWFWRNTVILSLFVATLILCERLNITVHYDTWIHRGMPSWGLYVRPPYPFDSNE